MILNVSGRCDIVAFYTKWFMNAWNRGYVDVRNPFNKRLVSRIYFSDVDLIVFCTKNPRPIIKYLDQIDKPKLFHITLTPYKEDIEVNVIKKTIIEDIKKVSRIVGIDNLYIRYDPIFISERYNIDYHKKAFDKLCTLLDGYVKHFIISFLDDYKNVRFHKDILKYKKLSAKDYEIIGSSFASSAHRINAKVQTCFEEITLEEYGFIKNDCISKELAFKLTGKIYPKWKARKEGKCKCACMVDIGAYNTCKHLCVYCYANYNEKLIDRNIKNHNDKSSLLIGKIESDDIIKIRRK